MATLANISQELPTPKQDEIKVRNFIGGQWYEPSSNNFFDNFNPSTGKVLCQIPDSGAADVDLAVKAAKDAFPAWSSLTPHQRAAHIYKLADLVEKNLSTMATFESLDQGKTLTMATNIDISRTAINFRFFADLVIGDLTSVSVTGAYPKAYPGPDGKPAFGQALSYVNRTPVGVAGLISPWNLPLYLLTWKIAPCIATGNTCVCKPSEFTSVTAMMLTKLIKQAGIPDGVVNMVFGLGATAGNALVTHPDVPLVSFTGGTATGKAIASATAPMFKHTSLELGGKNPALIFADSNLDECIPSIARSSFLNQGEICLCNSRIYVQKPIFDEFVSRFKEFVITKVTPGDPFSPASYYGPLVSKPHFEKVQSYVQLAREEGCNVEFCVDRALNTNVLDVSENGALALEGLEGGYFMSPTVITNVSQKSRLVQEEIFGPVVCILPFETEEEGIQLANDIQYGLAATVWSVDQSRLRRVASQIQAGNLWCNCWMVRHLEMPFGGFKASGLGTEGGRYSIDFFTKKQAIYLG
ncbi:hypothetical protein BB560_003180 [Smittium megazygosporum]|uniref:Aldehyde dehydrogenase domain-containing protein n=1 Tax=Smittium megazygosporum TaxID=133381 RepID=A0A2T9ZCN8_9FUNG|nr:hypothetical protein BB560_003180 [Smittium megazygosporum]